VSSTERMRRLRDRRRNGRSVIRIELSGETLAELQKRRIVGATQTPAETGKALGLVLIEAVKSPLPEHGYVRISADYPAAIAGDLARLGWLRNEQDPGTEAVSDAAFDLLEAAMERGLRKE
jgi:hypothetical protein